MKVENGQTDHFFSTFRQFLAQYNPKEIIKYYLIIEIFTNNFKQINIKLNSTFIKNLVGDAGLEPATAPLSGVCSTT